MLGRLQNSKVPKREAILESLQTSGLDSIKKHFPKPFAWGKHSSNERRDIGQKPLVPSRAMSRRDKRRHQVEDWLEPANQSDDDGQELHSNGTVHMNGGESSAQRQNQRQNHRSGQVAKEAQPGSSLQPYTSTVMDTTKAIAEVQKQLEKLSELYIKHAEDIENVTEVHRKSIKFQKECSYKDDKIRRMKYTILELRTTTQEEEAKLAEQREKVKEAEKKLKEEKEAQERKAAKAEKSIEAQKAQMELEMKKELESRQRKQEEEHELRMKQLEKEMSAREDSTKKVIQGLKAEKKRLSDDLERKKKEIEELTKKLKATSEQLEDSTAAKTSYKKQKEELEVRLNMIQNEFGFETKTTGFYERKFADFARSVEGISKHFKNLPPDADFNKIHEELKVIDQRFNSIPISEDETSENLRMAHVQRIISSALFTYIWQPFSSDQTSSHPEVANLLEKICKRLARNDLGGKNGRAALVWRILTMRGLQSADQDLPPSPVSTSHEAFRFSTRANQAVEDILKKLSPLVDQTQRVQIQEALLRLAQSAAEVWNFAQTDELKITASISLQLSDINLWRSAQFDPVSAAENVPAEKNIKSFTRPRVFTLFPQVTAQTRSATAEPSLHIPGSFSAPQQDVIVTETSVHPGIGLSESSALVIRGKSEEEERQARLKELYEEFENQKKEFARSGINRMSARSGSISGSVSGPLSPSARWAKASAIKTLENED